MQEDLGKMNWDLVEELRTAGDLGTVKKLQLFCSAQGATTACHYDMNQNIFLQLHGAKRFILFPPLLGMAALLPYPVANQRDRCARQDLLQEGPCSHLAHGRGVEAVLGPGDVLFLPQMWWHHVESLSAETVSVSLWLTTPRRTRWLSPFPQQQAAELAREWEFFLASEIGGGLELEQFLLWLSCPSCVPTAALPWQWLRCGALLLQHALRLLPPQLLRQFLGVFTVQRFRGLRLRRESAKTRRRWQSHARKQSRDGTLRMTALSLPMERHTGRSAGAFEGRKHLALRKRCGFFAAGWTADSAPGPGLRCSRLLLSAVALRARWRLEHLGREAWEIEGWPCSRATRKRSGHPRVTTESLRKVVVGAGLGDRFQLRSVSEGVFPEPAKLKGLMKAALARCNELLAQDALRSLSRLLSTRKLSLAADDFEEVAGRLLQAALFMQCPNEAELEAELGSRCITADLAWNERLMSHLVKDFCLGPGAGLYGAICLELGEPSRSRGLERLDIDPRLAFQPAFLEDLRDCGVCPALPGSDHPLPELVQRAALAAGGMGAVARRRHGAILVDANLNILAEGFNHMAAPLGPRRRAPLKTKLRETQRHAEVHCLLQLPRLKDALGGQMVVVELADVGPGLGWAEPCSRGCIHLLKKYGVAKVHFTDGHGGLVSRDLPHCPHLDVPYKTFARRVGDDRISERAWLDVASKMQEESEKCASC
ncbi:unnamed protein product [Effrenium voratum]|nr:unnamed protein product [Effrenium voratum]